MLARWSQICRPMPAPHVSQSLSLAGWKIIFWSLVVKWICFLWSTEILALPRNELPLSLTTSSDLHADQFPCLTNYWVHFHLIQYCSPPMSLLVEGGFKQASAIEVKSKAEMRRRLPLCLYWHIQIVNVYIYISLYIYICILWSAAPVLYVYAILCSSYNHISWYTWNMFVLLDFMYDIPNGRPSRLASPDHA